MVGRPQDAGDDVAIQPGAVGMEYLDGREAGAGVGDAGHPHAVVHVRRGNAG